MVSVSFSKMSEDDVQYQLANYKDDRSHVITIVTSVFFVLSFVFVGLRLLAKKIGRRSYGADDCLIVVALIVTLASWIEALLAARFGGGQHSLRVFTEHGMEYLIKNLQIQFALLITYNCAHFFLKLSILLYFRTIFTFVMVGFKRAWYCVLVYISLNFVICFILIFTQCQPYNYIWDEPKGLPGHCSNLRAIDISAGVLTIIADVMLLVLPMPVLWSLHRPTGEKVMLCALFALGCITIIASIVRIKSMSDVMSGVDFTYIEVDTLVWSVIEVNLGIICACIPGIKPLVTQNYSKRHNNTRANYLHSDDAAAVGDGEGGKGNCRSSKMKAQQVCIIPYSRYDVDGIVV